MLITLIFIGIFIVGIVLTCLGTHSSQMYWKARETLQYIGICCMLLGGIMGIITGGISIGVGINVDTDYENALYEREVLEYRLEHMDENIIGNELLYNDIVEFNNELRYTKKWAENPWTSWFFNQKIADIEYIELDMED